jgi:SSS family solute:Na+ symporter/sodium/proline symporter
VAAIAAGTVITLVWDMPGVRGWFPQILAQRDAIFPALFAAVAAMVVVSLFTRAPKPEQLAQFSD